MSTNELTTDRNYLDLTVKERADIAMGACKNPYDDAKVPLRSSDGRIKRHVPFRHDSRLSNGLTAVLVPVAQWFVDAMVQETFRYGAKWREQRKCRSSHVTTRTRGNDVIAHPGDDGARSTSEEPEPGHPHAEIIDLRTARERRASVG